MASLAQSIFSAKTLLVCLGPLPGASSGTVGILFILALFIVFLAPFDRRLLERYIKRVGAKASRPAPLSGASRSAKFLLKSGFGDTSVAAGPYTRQLCKMLDLEVVTFARRKFFIGCFLVELAIGRWNEGSREFEIVTEWCETWDELETQARQAIKSFRGIAHPKHRRA
ncbi:MAG TPA: hypothetical protein VNK23_05915 [Candidatus Dormibacteraeota bacterium]|nr:hypothetical protein [Candidatus Dormibacteraeota bacterium]